MDKVTPIGTQGRKRGSRRKEHLSTKSPSSQALALRSTEACQKLLSGKLPSEIAEDMSITVTEVTELLNAQFALDSSFLTDMERKLRLGMELMRLELLQQAVWPSAMMGDPKSVDSALKIISTRAKITGLEQVDPVVQKNLVLVMGEKEEDYINALKLASDD